MYLSKVRITGAACRNPYELHRRLWCLFDEDAKAERDFLFRVEQASAVQAELLLQSVRKPRGGEQGVELVGQREYSLELLQGLRVRFLLVANPVKTIRDEQGRMNAKGEVKSCRVPLIKEEEQRDWLSRKLLGHAIVEEQMVDNCLPMYFRKQREKHAGKIQQVRYQGVLNVEQPTSLVALIQKGVGPAKAFGCGLISLARC